MNPAYLFLPLLLSTAQADQARVLELTREALTAAKANDKPRLARIQKELEKENAEYRAAAEQPGAPHPPPPPSPSKTEKPLKKQKAKRSKTAP